MSDSRTPSTTRTDSRQSIAPGLRAAPRQRIDCGGTRDQGDSSARVKRHEGGDARHGYLTASGRYADQVQAI